MRQLGKILRAGLLLVLVLLLLCNLYVLMGRAFLGQAQPTVFGYTGAVVLSGSMSGSIEVNDLVIIHRETDYVPGDVITYQSGSALVTHRILAVKDGGFVTKGDANNTQDLHPISREQVVGKVVLVIPRVGAFISWLRSPMGLCVLVLLGFALLLPSLWEPRKQIRKGGGKYEDIQQKNP